MYCIKNTAWILAGSSRNHYVSLDADNDKGTQEFARKNRGGRVDRRISKVEHHGGLY
jgi:hypothetical protein